MSRLRVCFFSHSAMLDGAERSLHELVRQLVADHRARVTVVLPYEGPLRPRLKEVGAETLVCPYRWWFDPTVSDGEVIRRRLAEDRRSVLEFASARLSKSRPDVIVTNTLVIPWGALAAATLETPHVWYIREFGEIDLGPGFFFPLPQILDFVRASSNLVVTNSEAVRSTLFPGSAEDAVVTVYNSVAVPAQHVFANAELRAAPRRAKLLIAGTIAPHKGQWEAIRAVGELIRRGRSVELEILGTGAPEEVESLSRHIAHAELTEHVQLLGYRDDPYPIMSGADIVLVCSRCEAFGRVAVEAMLLGKPVIATAAGGIMELVTPGFNGLLYPPGDHVALADRIEALIEEPARAMEMGQNGLRLARDRFRPENYGGRVFSLLRGVTGSPNPGSARVPAPLLDAILGSTRDRSVLRTTNQPQYLKVATAGDEPGNLGASTSGVRFGAQSEAVSRRRWLSWLHDLLISRRRGVTKP